jgi:hypothetical protein
MKSWRKKLAIARSWPRVSNSRLSPLFVSFSRGPEVEDVELVAVRLEVAEQPESELVIVEDEAAKITGEALDAGARRDEVVIGADVEQVVLEVTAPGS